MFKKTKKSYKSPYVSTHIWRKTFLIYDNMIHRSKEDFIFNRSSTILPIFKGLKLNIHQGKSFHKRLIHRWAVGFKLGELTWTRKLALYKAKQLRKKKK